MPSLALVQGGESCSRWTCFWNVRRLSLAGTEPRHDWPESRRVVEPQGLAKCAKQNAAYNAHGLPISPLGGCLRSDYPGVANLGHHAGHHVVEIVAVKRPAAGVVGVKGD